MDEHEEAQATYQLGLLIAVNSQSEKNQLAQCGDNKSTRPLLKVIQ